MEVQILLHSMASLCQILHIGHHCSIFPCYDNKDQHKEHFHLKYITYIFHSGPENFNKSPGKKLVKSNKSTFFREIAFLGVLNFFLVQKLIFDHSFFKLQKMELIYLSS